MSKPASDKGPMRASRALKTVDGDSYRNAYGSYAPIPVMQTFKKYFVDASTCPFVNKTQSNIFEKMYANIAPALMGEFQEKRVDPCARYHGCVKVRFPEIKLQKSILDELHSLLFYSTLWKLRRLRV